VAAQPGTGENSSRTSPEAFMQNTQPDGSTEAAAKVTAATRGITRRLEGMVYMV
jgi:hypothetical protein